MATRPAAFSVFLIGISVALAILVALLARQNFALESALAHERAEKSASRSEPVTAPLVPGEILPALALLARDGSVERLAHDGSGGESLLLFYAEDCKVCPQVFLSWEELAPLFAAEGVRVAAVQLDRASPSAPYGPPGIESFALADFATVPLAKLTSVPLTLLVDGRGAVRFAQHGTLTPDDMGALVGFLPAGG